MPPSKRWLLDLGEYPDNLRYYNGVVVGTIYKEVDGYYVFVPVEGKGGFWEAAHLREIADILDDINRAWDTEVRDYFERERQREDSRYGTPEVPEYPISD